MREIIDLFEGDNTRNIKVIDGIVLERKAGSPIAFSGNRFFFKKQVKQMEESAEKIEEFYEIILKDRTERISVEEYYDLIEKLNNVVEGYLSLYFRT